jgi:hypothetical protein
MTPKEKARELYDKFIDITSFKANRIQAKQSALIMIDEVLQIMINFYNNDIDFWLDVKNEIKKL